MASEEKVECLKNIDLCNDLIKNAEKELEKCNNYITQGSIGLLLGLVSGLLGLFFPICFFGTPFALIGVIMLIVNILGKRNLETYLQTTRAILGKWKEKLYRLED